jgi:hypothetical protein
MVVAVAAAVDPLDGRVRREVGDVAIEVAAVDALGVASDELHDFLAVLRSHWRCHA